jgi:putative ATPase
VGKTTIAAVVSRATNRRFVELSAVTAGVKEVRDQIATARRMLAKGQPTVLFIDEVHRFNKAQQDVLLPAVENRLVTLIAATTENPSFSVIAPLLSRSLLLTLKPLTDDDLHTLVQRALTADYGLNARFTLTDDALVDLLRLSGGDARRILTYLEEAAASAEAIGTATIDTAAVERAVDKATLRYDKDGDQHYDVISAFIKSVRGSDVQAALHYLARMLEAGEDPRFIARRLVILASEDIGMAAPSVLQTCSAAALAPKSNAVVVAVDRAIADVRAGRIGQVPPQLRDAHYPAAARYGHGVAYRYAHDFPTGVVEQQYLPDELTGARYYTPTNHGNEATIAERLRNIESILHPTQTSVVSESDSASADA